MKCCVSLFFGPGLRPFAPHTHFLPDDALVTKDWGRQDNFLPLLFCALGRRLFVAAAGGQGRQIAISFGRPVEQQPTHKNSSLIHFINAHILSTAAYFEKESTFEIINFFAMNGG